MISLLLVETDMLNTLHLLKLNLVLNFWHATETSPYKYFTIFQIDVSQDRKLEFLKALVIWKALGHTYLNTNF